MDQIFLIYGFFTLIFAVSLGVIFSLIKSNKNHVFWKKHLKKRKKWFTGLAIFSLLLLWLQIEDGMGNTSRIVLWSIHMCLFLGTLSWVSYTVITDHQRIQSAIKRKERREKQK